jgi:fibronectin type 3 domain-containing protein
LLNGNCCEVVADSTTLVNTSYHLAASSKRRQALLGNRARRAIHVNAKIFFMVVCLAAFSVLVAGCSDNSSTLTSNEAPILAPQNVTVTMSAFGDIVVKWDANTQPTLKGYNVYRNDIARSQIALLTAKPTGATAHLDSGAGDPGRYEYRVTSVSVRGVESNPATAMIEVIDETTRTGDKKQTGHE